MKIPKNINVIVNSCHPELVEGKRVKQSRFQLKDCFVSLLFTRNDRILKKVLVFSLIFFSFSAFSQDSNKKKVLVIPYGRFEFVSEFTLDEIAEKNETSAANVFLIYQKALLNAFKNHTDENFEFVPIEAKALKSYKKFIKYKYGKFNGKQFNTVDLKAFNKTDFSKLLELYNADFILFVTWYDIQKEAFSRGGRHDKRKPYAAHYIDYDVYNLFKQHIFGAGKIKAEASIPNDKELNYKLLRIKEVQLAYANFISKVIEQLNKPIEN